MKKQKDHNEEPSEIFLRALEESGIRHGACRLQCGFCGRVHFDYYGNWDWEDGELEELIELSEKKPDEYVACDYTPTVVTIDSRDAVIGCPCNHLRKFEDWMWEHRDIMLTYYKEKVMARLESADSDFQALCKHMDKLKLKDEVVKKHIVKARKLQEMRSEYEGKIEILNEIQEDLTKKIGKVKEFDENIPPSLKVKLAGAQEE